MKRQFIIGNMLTILGFLGTVYSAYYMTQNLNTSNMVWLFLLVFGVSVYSFFRGASLVR